MGGGKGGGGGRGGRGEGGGGEQRRVAYPGKTPRQPVLKSVSHNKSIRSENPGEGGVSSVVAKASLSKLPG